MIRAFRLADWFNLRNALCGTGATANPIQIGRLSATIVGDRANARHGYVKLMMPVGTHTQRDICQNRNPPWPQG